MLGEHNNVLTLVATAEGLQLRVPNNQIRPLYNNLYPQQVQQLPECLSQSEQNTISTDQIISERINSKNSLKGYIKK